jgi:peptide/nickel transport system permease protein
MKMNATVRYIIYRFFLYFVVIIVGITIVFIIPRIGPVDPVEAALSRVLMMGEYTDPRIVESMLDSLRVAYGLKGTLWDQYLSFLQRAFTGDFGYSIFNRSLTVNEIITRCLPWTIGLLLTATVISWLLGNFIGLIAGYYKRKSTKIFETIALIVQPIPYYILALMLIYLLSYLIKLFPSSGGYSPARVPQINLPFIIDVLRHSFLPALSLILGGYGWTFLSMQAIIKTVKKEDYVLFAKIRGLPQNKIAMRYVMKNSMLPQYTQLALRLGSTFSGSLITEIIFGYPGLGYQLYLAITTFDLTVMMGIVTTSIIALASSVLVLDIVYPLIDPRIRFR